MADKKITDLQLISAITDTVNFIADDTIQTYRSTAAQLYAYLWPKWSTSRSVSASTTITSADRVIFADATSAGWTQALPALSGMPTDFVFTIKNITTGANIITLDANSTETIDGNLTIDIASMESVTLMKQSSTKWAII